MKTKTVNKAAKQRWIDRVGMLLMEADLLPQQPKFFLNRLVVEAIDDADVPDCAEIVRIMAKDRETRVMGVVTVQGRFIDDSVTTVLSCLASDSDDVDVYLAAPRMRGSWEVPLDRFGDHLNDTLVERREVMRQCSLAIPGPYHFFRPYGMTSLWS